MIDSSAHFHSLPFFLLPMTLRSFDFLPKRKCGSENLNPPVRTHAQEDHTFNTYSYFHSSKNSKKAEIIIAYKFGFVEVCGSEGKLLPL